MKGKQGAWQFDAFFILVMLIVFGAAFTTIYGKTNISSKFGILPKAILETYHRGEKILFYADYAAKNSIYQAAYDLGQKGGHYDIDFERASDTSIINCEDYMGYTLWQEECAPNIDSLKQNLGLYLNDNLNNYLLGYPEEDIAFASDNYDFLIKNDKIIGVAIENIEFNVKEAEERVFGIVSVGLNSRARLKDIAVDRIILHHTGGSTFESAYNTLIKRGLSVHYVVDRDGTVHSLVDEDRTTYHARGWNARSIGIEIVNTGNADMRYTDAQYNSINALIQDIASRWPGIEGDNEHVIGHYQASEIGKWDPSPNFEWARIGLPDHTILADLGKETPDGFGYA